MDWPPTLIVAQNERNPSFDFDCIEEQRNIFLNLTFNLISAAIGQPTPLPPLRQVNA